MKLETRSPNSPGGSTRQTGLDPLLEHMKARGIPLTRKHYLELAYPDGVPEPFPAELESELPPELRSF